MEDKQWALETIFKIWTWGKKHEIQLQLNCFRGTEYFFWILDYEEDGEGFRFGSLEEGENLVSGFWIPPI